MKFESVSGPGPRPVQSGSSWRHGFDRRSVLVALVLLGATLASCAESPSAPVANEPVKVTSATPTPAGTESSGTGGDDDADRVDSVVERAATRLAGMETVLSSSQPRYDEDPVLPTPVPLDAEPVGTVGPEPAFSGNEASALTCAHLERALRALETGGMNEITAALESAAEIVQSSDSDELVSLSAEWGLVGEPAEAERVVWTSLDVCVALDYAL